MNIFILKFLFICFQVYSTICFKTEFVPMRDGAKMAVDIFLPNKTSRYPVILEITPYGRQTDFNLHREFKFWNDNGYAFLIADVRGTGDSEGDFAFLANDGNDGYDLLEWITKQTWSNGKIGLRGFSYSGTDSLFIAAKNPPGLKCINPSSSAGRPIEQPPFNGAFSVAFALQYPSQVLKLKNNPLNWINGDPKSWLKHRPLKTLDVFVTGRVLPYYREFIEHPTVDSYWDRIIMKPEDYSKINIPTLSFTGWYDGTLYGTVMHFKEINKFSSRKNDHFLIIGPYSHSNAVDGGYDYNTKEKINMIGDVKLKDNAHLPGLNMTKEFFDWCLKNRTKPKWNQTRVYITNEWEEGKYFLKDNLQDQYLYLSSSKLANSVNGDGKLSPEKPNLVNHDSYDYDPNEPVRSDINPAISYPIDINFYLNRTDFLVYTSDVLKKPFKILDQVKVELSISSNVKDTDIVVFLMDVEEDGRSIKLGSTDTNALSTRYREGFDKEVLMQPNKIYNITINMKEIGHIFFPGHRIRLAITSSFYPFINANPNTGNPVSNDTDPAIKSTQNIHYGNPSNGIVSRIHFRSNNNINELF